MVSRRKGVEERDRLGLTCTYYCILMHMYEI